MRKAILIAVLVVTALTLTGWQQEESGECSVSVNLEAIRLVYNNHVGRNWSFKVAINDEPWIEISGYELPREIFQHTYRNSIVDLKVAAQATERDKYPDTGVGSENVQIQCPASGSSRQSLTIDVKVTENRGRYAGNSAIWEFDFEITAATRRLEQPAPTQPPAHPPVTPVIPPSPEGQGGTRTGAGILIQSIQPRGEDEIVTIVNNSGAAVDMTGWRLESSNSLGQETKETFWFPSDCIFPEDGILRIHSGAYARAWGDQGCGYSTIDLPWYTIPIWSDQRDVAWLWNDKGELVDTYAYGTE